MNGGASTSARGGPPVSVQTHCNHCDQMWVRKPDALGSRTWSKGLWHQQPAPTGAFDERSRVTILWDMDQVIFRVCS